MAARSGRRGARCESLTDAEQGVGSLTTSLSSIGVIGAGAWGTALANAAARAGCSVTLWARNEAQAAAMTATRRNPRLPNALIETGVRSTASLAEAVRGGALILATPTQTLRDVCCLLGSFDLKGISAIVAAKGIERETGLFVTDVVREVLPCVIPAILSGPGFAADVANGAPTAETLACADPALGEALARALGSRTFRIYHTTDVRGVEIGGAAKNVLAIAAGVAAGKGFGESAVAALIARAFAELTRFGEAFGARSETLAGLSGLGDLILTGTSSRSRNRRLGEVLGHGLSLDEAIAQAGLAEGVWTAAILARMAVLRGVDMPVANAVAALVAGETTVDQAIEILLTRPPKAETAG